MKLLSPLLLLSLSGLTSVNADLGICNEDHSVCADMSMMDGGRKLKSERALGSKKSFEEKVLRGGTAGRKLQDCPAGDCTSILKHHPDGETPLAMTGITCNAGNILGGVNSFGRCFDAINSGCTEAVSIDSVTFGVETLRGTTLDTPVTVNLYKKAASDCSDVAAIINTGTLVATEVIVLTPDVTLSSFTVPVTSMVVLAVGEALYAEFVVDQDTTGSLVFFPGATTATDCDESYIAAPDCGVSLNNPISLAAVGILSHTLISLQTSPVGPGAAMDPHFKTWTGAFFDFMGECDLVLLEAQDLTIQIRTKIEHDYSYIESAVVKIGEESFEVSSFGDYFLNGVAGGELPSTVSGFAVDHTQINKKEHQFTIDLGNGEGIRIKTFKSWVSVNLIKPSSARYQDSQGMMGEFGTGKLLGRDGVSVFEDPNAFAAEWQVHDTEPMLFESVRAPQYPQRCQLPSPVEKSVRRLGESSVSYEAAAKACATAMANNVEACIHDVMAIGDLELAAAGAF